MTDITRERILAALNKPIDPRDVCPKCGKLVRWVEIVMEWKGDKVVKQQVYYRCSRRHKWRPEEPKAK